MTSTINYGFIKTGSALTVHFQTGSSFTWTPDHPHYEEVIELIKAKAPASDLEVLMDVKKQISVATQAYGDFTLSDDGVAYKGKLLNMSLTERIVQMAGEGFDAGPMLRFLERLLKNPRREAVNSLYDFMEHNKLPITEDGHFLAYKIVRANYMDIYSGTFDNSVGKVCEMEPWEVEADREQTCSAGLHVCSKEYLPHYGVGGSKVMIVKVDPGAVVAVPRDYNNAKMRVWKYEVIGEMDSKESAPILERYGVFTEAAAAASSENFTWGDNAYDGDTDKDADMDAQETAEKAALNAKIDAIAPGITGEAREQLANEIDEDDGKLYTDAHEFFYDHCYFTKKPDGTYVEIEYITAEDLSNNGFPVFVQYDESSNDYENNPKVEITPND